MEPTLQTSEEREWRDKRLGKATSSEFGRVIARIKSGEEAAMRRNYRAELVIERITGQEMQGYYGPSMEWGHAYEGTAAMEYMLLTGNYVAEMPFIEHNTLQAGASPDRRVYSSSGDMGLLEIKCPNSANHIYTLKNNAMPHEHKPQVQGQMWITGAKWVDFMSYDPRMPRNAQIFIQRIMRDDEYIRFLQEEVEKFLIEVDEEEKFIKQWKGDNVWQ